MSEVLLAPAAAVTASRTPLPRVMYVVNLHPGQKFGSLEEQLVFLSQAFDAHAGQLVALFTFAEVPGIADGLRSRGVEAYCLDLLRYRTRTLWDLLRLTRRHAIDLVHWNLTNPIANPYVWGLTALSPRLRHFYTDHNSRTGPSCSGPTGWRRACKTLLLKRYEQVWCVSEFVQNALTEQGAWSNLRCCPHFINTDRFRPDAAVRARLRRECGVEDRFVITVIAQLIPEKGVDLAIRALAQLPEKAILWIVGSGAQADELHALMKTLALEKRMRFWGLQQHVEPILQASDCFVLPSRWQEAAGLVGLEAQATGLPMVASRIGGIPEYLVEGHSGLLFAPGDVQELAGHLRQLCVDLELRDRMAQAARRLALERFSPASRLPLWLDNYRANC